MRCEWRWRTSKWVGLSSSLVRRRSTGTSRIVFGAFENSSWRPNKSKTSFGLYLSIFPTSRFTLHFCNPATKHQSTKFSFRFGLDAGVARKALATSLVFRRESHLDVAVFGKARRPLLDLANWKEKSNWHSTNSLLTTSQLFSSVTRSSTIWTCTQLLLVIERLFSNSEVEFCNLHFAATSHWAHLFSTVCSNRPSLDSLVTS